MIKKRVICYLIFPILFYIFLTIICFILFKLFFVDINSLIVQGVSAFISSIVLYILYNKVKINIVDIEKQLTFDVIKVLVPLGFSFCIICNILLNIFHVNEIDKSGLEVTNEILKLNPIFSFIIAGVIIPFVEEIIFRAFMFQILKKYANTIVAFICSSLFFALFHFNLSQGIYALVVGFLLCFICYKYKNFLYSYILHLIMNVTSLLLNGFFEKYTPLKDKLFLLIIMLFLFIITIVRIRIMESEKK